MARNTTRGSAAPAAPAAAEAPAVLDRDEALAVAEIDTQIALRRSVVKAHYKIAYKEKARNAGIKGKAAKRSRWDWTAQILAAETLTKTERLDLPRFEALMAANGIDIGRWPNRSTGWEGRLRMTAGLVLRRQLADTGVLYLANGEALEMPADDRAALVAKFAL